MDIYETELQDLREHDEVQFSEWVQGYQFITTAGHGYLVVPAGDINYKTALQICQYGYIGNFAAYLEEDCEATQFLQTVKKVEA